ncbi:MAG: Spx/MgsR family RNA polymerase-binding regulatory protein [Planctomycetota bacterium]
MTSNPIAAYAYAKCDTCRRALRWLEDHGVEYVFVDITQNPPDAATLRAVLRSGRYELRHLFNTSGRAYRAGGVKDRLPGISEGEALELLAGDGMLVKRPIVTDGERHTVGFRAEVFEEVWG